MTISVVPASGLTWLFTFDPTGGGGVPAVQYAFGINTVASSFWFHFGTGPLDWVKIGSGSGGGSVGVVVLNEGVPIAGNPHVALDFIGAGVTAADAGGGVASITIPGAAPSLAQSFRYVVTGVEPDLSEIAITLPVAMPDDQYGVTPDCQGVTNIAAFDVAIAGITPTGFVLSTSGDLTAGDVISFVATRLT